MQAVAKMSNALVPQFWAGFRSPPVQKRVAKPLWKDPLVVINSLGREESFSIGLDGYVWSFETSTSTRRAGRLHSTGLRASAFAVGKAANGKLVVVAADGLALRYTTEDGDAQPSSRWAETSVASLRLRGEVLCLEKVFSKSDDGNLFFGFTACYSGNRGQMTREFWHGVWAGQELICGHHHMDHRYVHEFWFDTFCSAGHLDDLL